MYLRVLYRKGLSGTRGALIKIVVPRSRDLEEIFERDGLFVFNRLLTDDSPGLQGLEATLSDSKKKYGDKVNALLSAWEHVTNLIPGATPEATQSLIEWAHK